jgi:hypothetical protein
MLLNQINSLPKIYSISKGYTVASGTTVVYPENSNRKMFSLSNDSTTDAIDVAIGNSPTVDDFLPIAGNMTFAVSHSPLSPVHIRNNGAQPVKIIVITDSHEGVNVV